MHPIIPPLTVLDCLSTCKSIHPRCPPITVPSLTVLPSSTCSPDPWWPLQPCSASPFQPPLSSSSRPPFSALDVASVTDNPCGFAFLGSILPMPFLKTLLPPAGLSLCPSPCQYQGGSCLQFLASGLLHCASSSPSPVPPRLLVSSGSFSYYGHPSARRREAWDYPLPVSRPSKTSSLRYLAVPDPTRSK